MALGGALPASSKSFLDSRSVLAVSTGPKTVDRSFALLAFFVLERRPLAIVVSWMKSEFMGRRVGVRACVRSIPYPTNRDYRGRVKISRDRLKQGLIFGDYCSDVEFPTRDPCRCMRLLRHREASVRLVYSTLNRYL